MFNATYILQKELRFVYDEMSLPGHARSICQDLLEFHLYMDTQDTGHSLNIIVSKLDHKFQKRINEMHNEFHL